MPDLDELAVQLSAISRRLKDAGDGALTRRLSQAIGKAAEPVEQKIRNGLRPHLPNRYADVIAADLDVFRRTYTTGDEARVTVFARTAGRPRRRLRRLDDGILWHPVFGNRKEWREMGEPHVKPGWFSGPVEEIKPQVRDAISRALDDAVREVVRRG